MGNTRNPRRRDGDVKGLWRLTLGTSFPLNVKPFKVAPLAVYQLEQPRMRYCARPDPYMRGEWRAEPVNYQGRGVVYLFHGKNARLDAEQFAADKNRKDGFQ